MSNFNTEDYNQFKEEMRERFKSIEDQLNKNAEHKEEKLETVSKFEFLEKKISLIIVIN